MILLDSTLREGEQTPAVSFSINDKIEITKLLDEFGIEMIEIGHPSVSNSVYDAARLICRENLSAEVITHVRAVKQDIDKAISLDVDRIAIFLATSQLHLREKLMLDENEALSKIQETITYASDHGIKVRFTPEDSTRTNESFLIEVCKTAIEAGADRISIADTVGICTPDEMYSKVRFIKENVNVSIDVHCHNDLGLALANAISAVRAGADCVHTTINGIGERCGIVDLASMTMYLAKINGFSSQYKLELLTELSRLVEQASGINLSPHHPIVGINAFTHKSGVHTDGVLKNPKTYEPYSPTLVGQTRRIYIDKYTGKQAVRDRLRYYGIIVDDQTLLKTVFKIKELGDQQKRISDEEIIELFYQVRNSGLNEQENKLAPLIQPKRPL